MKERSWFIGRVFLAIGLMLGFYALALGLAGLLLFLPYAEYEYAHRLHIKLAIGCLIAAFAILKGCIFVRAPKFEAPGPELMADQHPELFAMIREVAGSMKTRMPQHVYSMADVNAFVAEVGGFMGLGTRRVMAIGVGLLNVDNVSQLKATIAHEFGHYAGGDTRLGGFVYRTRSAIGGVLQSLGAHWISKPFELYAKLYMRVSQAVSRQQELAADKASVELAGAEAHVSGLRNEGRGGLLFGAFVRSEVAPLVSCGFRPDNLYEGFRVYAAELEEQGVLWDVDKALASASTDPYDTHPSFVDRVEFARALPANGVPTDSRPARTLLRDPEHVEKEVTLFMLEHLGEGRRLAQVSWRDISDKVYAPKLGEDADRMVNRVHSALGGERSLRGAASKLIVAVAESGAESTALLLEPDLSRAPSDVRSEASGEILAHALGLLLGAVLVQKGARWDSAVGRPHRVRPAGAEDCIEPFKLAKEAIASRDKLSELHQQLAA